MSGGGREGLPLKLGRCSNGEFVPPPLTDLAAEAMRRARRDSEAAARRLGWSRRRFLTSATGMATGLLALQSCADDKRRATGSTSTTPATSASTSTSTTVGPGGTFDVAPAASTEPELATSTTHVPAGTLLIDVQNHLLDYELHPDAPDFGSGFPQAGCDEADPRDCFSRERWVDLVFGQSDTSMAVLSAIPVVGDVDPLSIEAMERGREIAESVCGDHRVLIQGHAVPNVGPLQAALDSMAVIAAEHDICAWKAYTHAGPGWYLDDHDPTAPQIGESFLAQVEALGVPAVCVHKGLSGDSPFASPVDVGRAAARHPQLSFLVYHSGYEGSYVERELSPSGGGVDRLITSVQAAGIGPGGNVYAELGSTWRAVMGDPDQAAHLLGKLLVALGPDNVVWGTDSIWYGSPQDQIAAFRAFQITPEFQERFGYPALTEDVKLRILGQNAARVLQISAPVATRCAPDEQAALRARPPDVNETLGPISRRDIVTTFVRDHPWVATTG